MAVATLQIALSSVFAATLSAGGPVESASASTGVLPVTLVGSHEAGAEMTLTKALVDGVSRGGAKVVSPRDFQMPKDGGCSDAACLGDLAKTAGVTHLIGATVSAMDRDYTIELRVANGDGEAVATMTEQCDICGLDEVAALLADLGASTQSKLETLERSAPLLRVTAAPDGARVFVDDKLVGTTPYAGEVSAGRHVIRVEAQGFIARTKRINGVEGGVESINVKLEPVPFDDAEFRTRRKALLGAGATSLGLGVALAGASVPLLLLHGQQNENRCDGNDVDVNGTCRFSYNTMVGGISLAATAAVAVAAGIGLLVRARVERKRLELRAGIGPTSFTLTGRF